MKRKRDGIFAMDNRFLVVPGDQLSISNANKAETLGDAI